jgi:exonuclease SbcD
MPSFRFLHAADLHLDSPLRGLDHDPEAPADRIRDASRDALRNLADTALREEVPLVVIAGDLFDGDWPEWRTGHYLVGQLARMTQAGIRVVMIRGNHDAQSVLTKHLVLPPGATLMDHAESHTLDLPEIGAAVHGQSFAKREVLDNLALAYPPPRDGRVNIGLLHTAAGGRDGHDNYAPCSVEQLAAHGYQYWALGHVHTREVLREDPWVVFPGNLQGRHIRETGAKGATLVTVQGGRVTGIEHRTLDVVRWEHLELDLTGAADMDAVWATLRAGAAARLDAAGGRLLALRVSLLGPTAAHAALMRGPGAAADRVRSEVLAVAGPHAAWVEKVRLRTYPAAAPAAPAEKMEDAVQVLVQAIQGAAPDAVAAAVRDYAKDMLARAGGLRDALGADHPAVLAAAGAVPDDLMRRARAMLLARLLA